MAKQYTARVWKNSKTGNTPINADALNHIESGIDNTDTRISTIETEVEELKQNAGSGSNGMTDEERAQLEQNTSDIETNTSDIASLKETEANLESEINSLSSEKAEQIDSAVAEYLTANLVSGGMTATAKKVLIYLLKNAVFTADMTTWIDNLEKSLATSDSGTDDDVVIPPTTLDAWLYHFDSSIRAEGEKDFGFVKGGNFDKYQDYPDGTFGKAVNLNASTTNSSWNTGYIYNDTVENPPKFDGDFTIAFWAKNNYNATRAHYLCTTSSNAWGYNKGNIAATLVDADNWTLNNNSGRYVYEGYSISWNTSLSVCWESADETTALMVSLTPVNGWNQEWHHYAITRKDSTIRIFVDGKAIATAEYADELYSSNRMFIRSYLNNSGVITGGYGFCMDELLIDDKTCRYTADFEVPTVPYTV